VLSGDNTIPRIVALHFRATPPFLNRLSDPDEAVGDSIWAWVFPNDA